MGSGIRTFTNGEVLTDALINGYLMQQATVTCTSGTRPASPTTGQPIYETDTKLIRVWDGSTWYCPISPDYVDWSASVRFYSNITSGTQISTGSVSVSYAKYQKINTKVHYIGHATINTTVSGANGFGLLLPFNVPYRSFSMQVIGMHGTLGNSNYANCTGEAHVPPISAPYNRVGPVDRANSFIGVVTSGDTVHWNITYESV
jgi:hypothetical protein